MIISGKNSKDLYDIFIHDWNDEFGVHYGINTGMYSYIVSYDENGTPNLSYIVDDHDTAMFFDEKTNTYKYLYPSNINAGKGETFIEAKQRYKSSELYNAPAFDDGTSLNICGDRVGKQHSIYSVFLGNKYIWPSRSAFNYNDINDTIVTVYNKYVFKWYDDQFRSSEFSSTLDYIVDATGGYYNVFIDSNNSDDLYKCEYSFVSNDVNVYVVENPDLTIDGQRINYYNSDSSSINHNRASGSIFWDYVMDRNTVIDPKITSDDIVDSTCRVIISPNKTPFQKNYTIKFQDQYDQYKGFYTFYKYVEGEPVLDDTSNNFLTLNITQSPDTLKYDTITFYSNDNISSTTVSQYGDTSGNSVINMTAKGGTGYIYFKITGESNIHKVPLVYGYYPSETTSNLRVGIQTPASASISDAKFNPTSGIWTLPIQFDKNINENNSSSITGQLILTSDGVAKCNANSTTKLTISGINMSNSTSSGVSRNFNITIYCDSNSKDNPQFTSNINASTIYSQNGLSTSSSITPNYTWSISDTSIATIDSTGVVTWTANNSTSSRSVTVRCICTNHAEAGSSKAESTIIVSQSGSTYDYTNEKTKIVFYEDKEGTLITTNYIVSGYNDTFDIYYRISTINENGNTSYLTDISGLSFNIKMNDGTNVTNIVNTTVNTGTNIITTTIRVGQNNGTDQTVDLSSFKATSNTASWEAGAQANINITNPSIISNGSTSPSFRTFDITVTNSNGSSSISESCEATQSPGTTGTIISSFKYTYSTSIGFDELCTLDISNNSSPIITWLTINNTGAMRGGEDTDIYVDVSYNEKTIRVYPQQTFYIKPTEKTYTSITIDQINIWDDNKEYKDREPVLANKGIYNITTENYSVSTIDIYFEVIASVKWETKDDNGNDIEGIETISLGNNSGFVDMGLIKASIIDSENNPIYNISVSNRQFSTENDETFNAFNLKIDLSSNTLPDPRSGYISIYLENGSMTVSDNPQWVTTYFGTDNNTIYVEQAKNPNVCGEDPVETTEWLYVEYYYKSTSSSSNVKYTSDSNKDVTTTWESGSEPYQISFKIKGIHNITQCENIISSEIVEYTGGNIYFEVEEETDTDGTVALRECYFDESSYTSDGYIFYGENVNFEPVTLLPKYEKSFIVRVMEGDHADIFSGYYTGTFSTTITEKPEDIINPVLNFYIPTTSDASYDATTVGRSITNIDEYNGKSIGSIITDTNISTNESLLYPDTMRIVVLSYTQINDQTIRKQPSLTKNGVIKTISQDTSNLDLWYFDTDKNDSTSDDVYTISYTYSDVTYSLTLTVKGTPDNFRYEITWDKAIFGLDSEIDDKTTSAKRLELELTPLNTDTDVPLIQFRIHGLKTTYNNEILISENEDVWISKDNVNYIRLLGGEDYGSTFYFGNKFDTVTPMPTVFYLWYYDGALNIEQNISYKENTSPRALVIYPYIIEKTDGNTTWKKADFSLIDYNNSTMMIKQLGNTWCYTLEVE